MNIDKITIGGNSYDIQDVTSGYSKIEITNLLQSGIVIGTITLNGQNYIIQIAAAFVTAYNVRNCSEHYL